MPAPRAPRPSAALLIAAAALAACSLAACSEERSVPAADPPSAQSAAPEDPSQAIGVALLELSDELRRRDFGAALDRLAPGFRGRGVNGLAVHATTPLPLGAQRVEYDAATAPEVDAGAFLASVGSLTGHWKRVDAALVKSEGAGEGGEHELLVHLAGRDVDDRFVVVRARAAAGVEPAAPWRLTHFDLRSLEQWSGERIFTDVSLTSGVAGGTEHTDGRDPESMRISEPWSGAAAADVDRDGSFDLFVPGAERSYLYRARGDGTFREEAEERGLAQPGGGGGAVFLDCDNDDDPDLVVARPGGGGRGAEIGLAINDGAGKFAAAGGALALGAESSADALAAFDYDRDGFLDLYAGGALLRNAGGARFEDATTRAGLAHTPSPSAAAAADLDGDGDLDLCVVGGAGTIEVHRNRGDGTFEDFPHGLACAGALGVSVADLDGDAVLDLAFTGLVEGRAASTIAAGQNGGRFKASDPGSSAPTRAWWSTACDLDLDGKLDLLGSSFAGDLPELRLNQGGLAFADLSALSGCDPRTQARSAIAADFDDDGDLDLFLQHVGGRGRHALYRNELDARHGGFVKIRLLTTASQHEAIGAIVTVRGQHGSATQLVSRGSGFSARAPELVFGVGESRLVRADVRWPGGRTDSYGGIRRNSRVLLVETLAAPEPIEGHPARLGDPAPGR